MRGHPTENLQREYEILEYIGGGGFADVYKAKANSKIVAIKVPRELKPEFEEIFLNEVENWRKLDHRNIVKLIRPRLNPPHLVLEYVDGGTLKDKLKKRRLSVVEACKIAYDVAKALEYAHSKLIIHTDINPKNVLLTSFGEAKLTDFGLAKIVTSSSGIRGLTLEYSAPEQLKGKADEKTDVYQLGLLLYEMLTGVNPFSAGDIQEIERRIMEYTPDPPSKFVEDAKEIDDLIMRCLSKNSNERPSIREFRQRIYEFMKKSYGVSLHLTKDFRTYARMRVELAFYSAKEGDLGRCLAELKAAREKVGEREIREELDKAIEMVEYMIRENIYSEDFLRMLEVLIKQM
ncbi:serine/threonine protein kinase [Archaeoglobus sp.]